MGHCRLNGYLMENRNLYRINDTNKRQKLLKQGRLPVVSFISEMPQTSNYSKIFSYTKIKFARFSLFYTTILYFRME